jgi:hypothetical protein
MAEAIESNSCHPQLPSATDRIAGVGEIIREDADQVEGRYGHRGPRSRRRGPLVLRPYLAAAASVRLSGGGVHGSGDALLPKPPGTNNVTRLASTLTRQQASTKFTGEPMLANPSQPWDCPLYATRPPSYWEDHCSAGCPGCPAIFDGRPVQPSSNDPTPLEPGRTPSHIRVIPLCHTGEQDGQVISICLGKERPMPNGPGSTDARACYRRSRRPC